VLQKYFRSTTNGTVHEPAAAARVSFCTSRIMPLFRSCATLAAALLALATTISAQTVVPSNDSSEIPSYESSPRFWVNGTNFPSFRVVPLGWYVDISHQNFLGINIEEPMVHVDDTNANDLSTDTIYYLSCDPEDYTGVLGPDDVFRIVATAQSWQSNTVILYSTRANHCEAYGLRQFPVANGIFTTLNPVIAGTVAKQISNSSAGEPSTIVPDMQSYTTANNSESNQSGYQSGHTTHGSTTAVAMIILYTITGVITALFVVIIVTGAIRAHRHPERYGPTNTAGRPRRTRAKGIARAMLDTIPIVKFGDKDETPQNKEVDIEMVPSASSTAQGKSKSATAEVTEAHQDDSVGGAASGAATNTTNPDGTDESGQLGCSICTEDFNKGEEVRVLPCNHKYHPECVDPWLLNVSGTCPLCRIDLRPKNEQQAGSSRQTPTAAAGMTGRRTSLLGNHDVAPPLGHLPLRLDRDRRNSNTLSSGDVRRDTNTNTNAFAGLRSVASGSREDRIAALRRFRQQRRNRTESGAGTGTAETETPTEQQEHEEERRGLSRRLRERFRIRTRRQGEDESAEAPTESSSRIARQQRHSMAGMPRSTWHT